MVITTTAADPVCIEYDQHVGAWQIETACFSAADFVCSACDLVLNGRVELATAGLPEEYDEERDVKPDYGND